jgi:hypothetical protein
MQWVSGNFSLTFWDNLSVPFSGFKNLNIQHFYWCIHLIDLLSDTENWFVYCDGVLSCVVHRWVGHKWSNPYPVVWKCNVLHFWNKLLLKWVVVKCCNILFVDQPHWCWAGGIYQACQCWADSQCWSTTQVLSRQCWSGMPVLISHTSVDQACQCWADSVGQACQCWADSQCWSVTPVLSRQC